MTDQSNSLNKMAHKKGFWIAGVGTSALVVWYFHKRKQSQATAAAATTTAADTSATDTSSTDGTDYSSDYGYSPADSYGLGGYGGYSSSDYSYDPTTGEYYPTGGVPYNGGTTGTATITTNAEWGQAAEAALTAAGYPPATSAVAIGKYLLGTELTSDQLAVVQAAIGLEGQPPQAVPPPQLAPPSSAAGSGTSASKLPPPSAYSSGKGVFAWHGVKGTAVYNIYYNGGYTQTVPGNTYTLRVKKAGSYQVAAVPATGVKNESARSNSVTVTP